MIKTWAVLFEPGRLPSLHRKPQMALVSGQLAVVFAHKATNTQRWFFGIGAPFKCRSSVSALMRGRGRGLVGSGCTLRWTNLERTSPVKSWPCARHGPPWWPRETRARRGRRSQTRGPAAQVCILRARTTAMCECRAEATASSIAQRIPVWGSAGTSHRCRRPGPAMDRMAALGQLTSPSSKGGGWAWPT